MVIVTGGAGLIGSAVIWGLNQRGIEDILVVDHLGTSEKWKNLRGLRFSDYLEKDVFRLLVQDSWFTEVSSAVIHLGACSSTTEEDAGYLVNNNFEYTRELAEFCLWHDIRFIYASSAATYGDGAHGYRDDEDAIDNLRPLNMYGYSKQMFDQWALRKGHLAKIVGLKYSNVFGPNEYHKEGMRSMILRAYEQIQADGVVRLFKSYRSGYADGEQVRDFLYVKDAVDMTLFFLEHPEANGLFNIGSGITRSWNDLAKAVFAALGRKPKIEYIDMPETLRDKYQYHTCLEMKKLRAAGYKAPASCLENAITDYVCRYLVNDGHLE